MLLRFFCKLALTCTPIPIWPTSRAISRSRCLVQVQCSPMRPNMVRYGSSSYRQNYYLLGCCLTFYRYLQVLLTKAVKIPQTISAWVNRKLNESRNKMDMIQTQSGDAVKQATAQSTVIWATVISTERTPTKLLTATSPYTANTTARYFYNTQKLWL